jgi:hypothetical protein
MKRREPPESHIAQRRPCIDTKSTKSSFAGEMASQPGE